MKRCIITIALIFFTTLCSLAQVVRMSGISDDYSNNSEIINRPQITKESVRLLTIGVGKFEDQRFEDLNSYSIMDGYKKVSKEFFPLSYPKHPSATFLNGASVKVKEVRNALSYLASISGTDDVVIVPIFSHGEIVDGEYYLICSDTNSENYPGTAISGSELRNYFEKMANNGAIVIVFLDTCHAEALFENSDFSPRSNGSIVYFASSRSYEEAKEINQQSRFSSAILNIFQNKEKYAFNEYGYATINSMDAKIREVLGAVTESNRQEPIKKAFSNNDNIYDYPIIKEKEIIQPPHIWKEPKPFSPFAVSNYKGKGLDYALISLEGLSIASFVTCGVIQEVCKKKLMNTSEAELRNQYRITGRNAAIGCWASAGVFLTSYFLKVWHVRYQFKIKFIEDQYAALDIKPIISPTNNGLMLVYNF